MKKRIFITGAAGFIGFHFAKACLEKGHTVFSIDNFNDYYSVSLKHDRAKELEKSGLVVHKLDLSEGRQIQELIQKEQITHVVHLAAQAGVRYSFDHPEVYVQSNVQGFLNILEGCRKVPGIRLVYASSSSVYGLNDKVPFAVSDQTDRPANIYAVTKKTNELMAQTYHYLYGLPVIGMRFFTVYGPWGRPDMAYFSFTKAILEGNPITVYNNGACLRDFTYIDDVVGALISALDCQNKCAIFNIGNHTPQSVEVLTDLIERETGKFFVKKFLPMQKGEIDTTYADITSSQKELGFTPKTSLAEGIVRFVAWYRRYYSV